MEVRAFDSFDGLERRVLPEARCESFVALDGCHDRLGIRNVIAVVEVLRLVFC